MFMWKMIKDLLILSLLPSVGFFPESIIICAITNQSTCQSSYLPAAHTFEHQKWMSSLHHFSASVQTDDPSCKSCPQHPSCATGAWFACLRIHPHPDWWTWYPQKITAVTWCHWIHMHFTEMISVKFMECQALPWFQAIMVSRQPQALFTHWFSAYWYQLQVWNVLLASQHQMRAWYIQHYMSCCNPNTFDLL